MIENGSVDEPAGDRDAAEDASGPAESAAAHEMTTTDPDASDGGEATGDDAPADDRHATADDESDASALAAEAAAGVDDEDDGRAEAAIDGFEAELRRTDPELEGLEDPVQGDALEAAEVALDVDLPPSFRRFLRRHNGGSAHDTNMYGVGTEDEFDLVTLNLRDREDGLPEHLVAFAASMAGDLYCFDTSLADERGEAPVVLLDPEDGTIMNVAPTFAAWLERLPRLETEVAEARGPQPMTVDEWEAFLVRERAKLRKLSQTPARQLTMPDPEQVRADLGGKIPVDPRHLKPRE